MPNWNDPVELQLESVAFLKLMHVLAGVYFWEVAASMGFDWLFISGKKRFQWPMVFYFMGRYCLFFALIGILIALDTTTEINCQSLYTFNQLLGNAAVGFASINLAIRTMAMWHQNKYIVIPLVIIILGHWSLILQGVLLKASWIEGVGCAITETNNTVLAATFIYSMCFDLIVLVLSAVRLLSQRGGSQIVKMLFKDGLIYFFIAFAANFVATVFMCLRLNPIMSVIFNVPAAVASTIVACRAVRRLSNFASRGPEVYSASHASAGRPTGSTFGRSNQATIAVGPKLSEGVHVQMETFRDNGSVAELVGQRKTDIESGYNDQESNSDIKHHPIN